MTKDEVAAELQTQRANVIGYIKAGYNGPQIADAEGLPVDECRKLRNRIAKEENLAIAESERDQFTPLGLNEFRVRQVNARLGTQLGWLYDSGLNRYQVGRLVGLSGAEQFRAKEKRHAWTLPQILRLAQALDRTLDQVMGDALGKHILERPK